MQRRRRIAAAVAALLAASVLVTSTGSGAQPAPPAAPGGGDDTVEVGPDYNDGRPLPVEGAAQRRALTPAPEAAVPGEVRTWLGLDDVAGSIYLKDYELRGVGERVEIWVSTDLDFQAGDCRNDGVRNVITAEQVAYFIEEFDENILPKESEAFSVAPERDGTAAELPGLIGLPTDYYAGEGDNTVVLVDNVRDANWYDLDNSQGNSYIAGFFYSVFNDFFDRNVMSIDSFDWLHRTGATPPDDPSSDLCLSAPARPFLYEGVFAHEYQHLLQHYTDPDETTWLNEGLSDWAQTLTGYVDPAPPITDQDFDSHIQCFLGYLGVATPANPNPRDGGPENSLTLWGDQGDGEILCDYGAAYSMVEMLQGRYGTDFITALHNDPLGGLESLDGLLAGAGSDQSAMDVLHDWAAMVALDGVLDDNGGRLRGAAAERFRTPTLDATINWDTPDTQSTPGAPPNGSDYVRLRDDSGEYLGLRDLRSLSFDGSEVLPTLPVEWTVDPTGGADGGPALYSGAGDNLDRAIVTEVAVPVDPTAAVLSFGARYQTEQGWDFGFVQVSTDGGESYTSLPATGTTSESADGAVPQVTAHLPGFTGDSGGWTISTADLSGYAGQSVLLAFRYITDPSVTEPGFWVDDVMVGGEVVSDGSSLEPFSSATEVNPIEVAGWNVTLIAYSSQNSRLPALIMSLPLDEGSAWSSSGRRGIRGWPRGSRQYDVVAAIVTQDDPTETVAQYAPYELRVNDPPPPS